MGNTIRLCLIQLPDHQGPILPSLSGSSNASSGTLSDGDPDSTTPRKKPPQQQQQHHLQRRLLSSKFLQSFKKTRRSFKARKRNNNHHDADEDGADEVCYDYYDYHYDDEEERERGLDSPVWQRTILMGERCEPPEFSGVILYDAQGNRVPEYPRSPLHKKYWSPSIRTTQLQHSS